MPHPSPTEWAFRLSLWAAVGFGVFRFNRWAIWNGYPNKTGETWRELDY